MERSSGTVIYKDKKFLLLKYSNGHWGFVKGHIEGNESEKEAMFRETLEETGLKKEDLKLIENYKEKISYYFKKNNNTIYKEVIFFLAKSNTFNVKLSHEHQDYEWLEYNKAFDKLTFENSKNLLKKANKILKK